MIFVITGGGGYTGFHIGWKLAEGGHVVRLVDIKPSDPLWEKTAKLALEDALPKDFWSDKRRGVAGNISFHHIDILDQRNLRRIFHQAHAVLHTASYGVSGQEQMSPFYDKQENVNLNGTLSVIEAAVQAKVKCLVFTSTYNVVFGGDEIVAGDESHERFPLYRHIDHYSRTKSIAEMLVLTSNGRLLGSYETGDYSGCLRTCALRFNGIMGLGERRHTERVISALRSGLFFATYGDRNALVDFVGIQNVVQAHIRAVFQLLEEQKLDQKKDNPKTKSSFRTSGNAFFISDESPVNNFEFFRPLIEGLGYKFPSINLPFICAMLFAKLQALIYSLVYRIYPFTPLVTPAEAFKTGRTHYFGSGKAFKAFGYRPTRPNDLSQVLNYYTKNHRCEKTSSAGNLLWALILIGLILFVCFFIL